MDPLDNPRMPKRPAEDPAKPAYETETRKAQEAGKQALDSELPVDAARREKIENLKKTVADGTYRVSSEEVARKIIENMLEPKE
jgi:anti-sigma28 factor (negative regulator of flagellin synthesis)